MSLSGVYSTATYSDTYIMHRCKAKRNASLLSMTLYKKSGESQKGRSPLFVRFMLETLVTLCHVVIMDTNKYERVVVFWKYILSLLLLIASSILFAPLTTGYIIPCSH